MHNKLTKDVYSGSSTSNVYIMNGCSRVSLEKKRKMVILQFLVLKVTGANKKQNTSCIFTEDDCIPPLLYVNSVTLYLSVCLMFKLNDELYTQQVILLSMQQCNATIFNLYCLRTVHYHSKQHAPHIIYI